MDPLAVAATESSPSPIVSKFWIALFAMLAPTAARLSRGYVPDVVFLLVFGMVLGPNALGWAGSAGGVDLLSELGLGMLFLLAGYELDPALLRGKPGRTAWAVWGVCLLFALGLLTLVAWDVDPITRIAVAIAMTSTALGTLLPIVKQEGVLEQPLGRAVLAHGAVGEPAPIIAMSVLLSSRNVIAAVAVVRGLHRHRARSAGVVERALCSARGEPALAAGAGPARTVCGHRAADRRGRHPGGDRGRADGGGYRFDAGRGRCDDRAGIPAGRLSDRQWCAGAGTAVLTRVMNGLA